jgi:acyl-CoA synthetase (AMP-forming)/AMP-acid ligase II/aryl carrier-like protein
MIIIGGEQLSAHVLRKWKNNLLPQASFVNEYGPTEAVVGCSVWKLSDESGLKALDGATAAPIGRPISNTQLYVLGEGGQLQPHESIGELHIGGAGLARGYLNHETLTRERFIPNPFSKGSRLYKTGDLVKWSSGGELAFVGRRDDQVKIRGYRIELGEIEQRLGAMDGVSAAVVIARADESGRKRLVAYVMPSEYPAEIEQQAGFKAGLISGYRETLAASLPDYMVPSAFVILDELPLTPNGKLDRKALPSPEGENVQAALYVAPSNATEEAMCEVWQEVLGRERIGVEDNFFSLGGDSILSIRIVSLLKGRGITLDIKDIFQHQTVQQLAVQAKHYANLTISKMSNDAADKRERLSNEGKEIEEGVF